MVYGLPLVLEAQLLPARQVACDLLAVHLLPQAPLRDLLCQFPLSAVQLAHPFTDIAVHHIICPCQPFQQGVDLLFQPGQLQLPRGQLRICGRAVPAAEPLEHGHLFLHLIVNQILKIIGVDCAGPWAGLGVHPVGAEQIAGLRVGIVLIHQGVPADSTLHFSRQPSVFCLLIRPHLFGIEALQTALEPGIRRDNPLMGGQNQVVALQIHLFSP